MAIIETFSVEMTPSPFTPEDPQTKAFRFTVKVVYDKGTRIHKYGFDLYIPDNDFISLWDRVVERMRREIKAAAEKEMSEAEVAGK